MNKIYKYLLLGVFGVSIMACEDLDSLNQDPNNPDKVPSHMVVILKWILISIFAS